MGSTWSAVHRCRRKFLLLPQHLPRALAYTELSQGAPGHHCKLIKIFPEKKYFMLKHNKCADILTVAKNHFFCPGFLMIFPFKYEVTCSDILLVSARPVD